MRDLSAFCVASLIASLVAACGSEATPPARTPAPEARTSDARPAQTSADTSQAQVAISEDIRRACGISKSEAYFSYNSAKVSAGSQGVLSKLAACFSTGPLKGREMRLVGHADPRGDEEYNLVLGDRRAQSVRRSLTALGLSEQRVSTTSRGEIDATGSYETGWAEDRRVDVVLGS
jgi:peptidoglycan-associated lipoprotein